MVGQELTNYLQDEGIGTANTDLFLGSQPETPNNCVTVYEETAPVLPEYQAFSVDSVGIQVLARNVSYFDARDKIIAIHKKLSGFMNNPFEAGGYQIRRSENTTPPHSIGKDDKGRSEWSAHYIFEFETSGNENRT